MFDLQLPLTCKPWTTLSNPCNKVRGKYFVKEVFLRRLLLRLLSLRRYVSSIYMYISAWISRWQYNNLTNQQLDGHQPPITKTIKVRRTRHAGHWWRSRDELISDILLWTPSHGRAQAGWLARTYIQQLFADTVCSLEELPEVMDSREGGGEGLGDPCWWCDIMMMMNCVEIIAIQVCKKLVFIHLKMKWPTNYECKQMTVVKFWLLYNNTWNHSIVSIKWAQAR